MILLSGKCIHSNSILTSVHDADDGASSRLTPRKSTGYYILLYVQEVPTSCCVKTKNFIRNHTDNPWEICMYKMQIRRENYYYYLAEL